MMFVIIIIVSNTMTFSVERVELEARKIQLRGNTCREHLQFLAEDLIDNKK